MAILQQFKLMCIEIIVGCNEQVLLSEAIFPIDIPNCLLFTVYYVAMFHENEMKAYTQCIECTNRYGKQTDDFKKNNYVNHSISTIHY